MPISASGNIKIAMGIHATAGIGRRSSRGVAIISSSRCEEPIKSPITIPRTDPAKKPPMTLVILDWKWNQGDDCIKATKAVKTEVGAGINWKLTIKLTFSVLRICQTIRKKIRYSGEEITKIMSRYQLGKKVYKNAASYLKAKLKKS